MNFLAESFFHTIDPFAIQITSTWGIRWYGVAYIVGFVVAWAIIRWFAKTNRSSLSVIDTGDMLFYIIMGVLLGGRIGYAIFYKPALFIGFSSSIPWWDLLAINQGGMSSHGGMLGVILAFTLFARRRKLSALHAIDLGALACTPGLCFGRLANFVNGELPGRVLPEALWSNPPWWSVKYPDEALGFESLSTSMLQVKENLTSIPGAQFLSQGEIVAAAKGGEPAFIDALTPVLTPYYPSQIFQAITDGPMLGIALALIWLRPRKPGVIGCWFLIVYGVLRIASEYFRQPDEGIAMLLGFSRGQVLSAGIIAVGAGILAYVVRRNVPRMGGLLPTRKTVIEKSPQEPEAGSPKS
jgi:phosphatidylglycerol:prolipoprotein diacylglycerol transferase